MIIKTIFDAFDRAEHTNAKSVLRSIRVIYFSMILGLVAFSTVAFRISSSDYKFQFGKSDPILITAIILFMLSVPTGAFVAKAVWKKISEDLTLKDKLLKYQPGFLIRLATCEGPGLFSVIGFLLTNNLLYIVLTALILMIVFFYYPSAEKIGQEINLTDPEMEELRNKI
jgi:hypothetical protein